MLDGNDVCLMSKVAEEAVRKCRAVRDRILLRL